MVKRYDKRRWKICIVIIIVGQSQQKQKDGLSLIIKVVPLDKRKSNGKMLHFVAQEQFITF